jgi:hypothetical protein
VRSGPVTDELCDPARRGLLVGTAEAASLWGGPELQAMVEEGSLVLRGVETIHDVTAISSTDRFVAINTLQGLDDAERVDRLIAVAAPEHRLVLAAEGRRR